MSQRSRSASLSGLDCSLRPAPRGRAPSKRRGWPKGCLALTAMAMLLAGCAGGGAAPMKPAPPGGAAAPPGATAAQPAAQAPTASSAPVTLNFAYTGPSAAFTPVWVAFEAGHFQAEAIELTLTSVQPAPGAQALIAGDFDIEATGPQVVDARLGGADLVYIADLVPVFVFDVYTQPEIRAAADLRGGSIGITQPGATTDFAAQAFARRNGLQIGQDLQVNFVGSMPGLVASLSNKLISSAILSAPSTLAANKAGMHKLVALAELKIPFEHAALVASRAWVQGHADQTRRFLRAYVRGIETTRNNPDAALQAISKYTQVTDPEELRESYEAFRTVIPLPPRVAREAVQAVIDYHADPRAKSLEVESLIYDSLIP
jgi:ABC-type nitrate/sulfonate/bicarbonate transport system substrate-binding protein